MNENFHPSTKVLNEILDKYKTHGDNRGLGYIDIDETPSSGEIVFFKGKDDTLNQVESLERHHYARTTRKLDILNLDATLIKFLERFETQMNRLMNDFNSFKNNILNNGKDNKTN